MANTIDFFREKKPWSKYKDLILDYYLQPYLEKIKNLRKPILIVDCFAGPGRFFEDGEPGSPLIILDRLRSLHERGFNVCGFFIEQDEYLYDKLTKNVKATSVPCQTRCGDFRNFVQEISQLARDSSAFVYLDPLRPSDLLFNDMRLVYDYLRVGRSVETLINFMSWNFLRGVWGNRAKIISNGRVLPDHHLTLQFDKVAGGTYWQNVAFESVVSENDRADKLAEGYAAMLHTWFQWVLKYAIKDKYEAQSPKYHLIFGSRHPDALELMNCAMVKARREFVKDGFIVGHLFPNQPDKEVIKPKEIEKVVVDTAKIVGKTTWKNLRVRATIANPYIYTDSEFDRGIKQAIKEGLLCSDCPGTKVEESATVWPGSRKKGDVS